MSEEKDKYLNFPIQLIKGFMDNPVGVFDSIFNYCCYKKTVEIMEWGEDIDGFKSSLKYWNVNIKTSDKVLKKWFDDGKKIYDSIPERSPFTGIKIDVFWDYSRSPKTDFQIASLLGFLAMKSIIGDKAYFNGTDLFWLSRMDGNISSVDSLNDLSEGLIKFTKVYQKQKIKKSLEESWGLVYYSYRLKGWYASFKLPLKELIAVAEKNRIKYKEEKRKRELRELRNQVLNEIKGATS